jgi:hypothetical protein
MARVEKLAVDAVGNHRQARVIHGETVRSSNVLEHGRRIPDESISERGQPPVHHAERVPWIPHPPL